MLPPPFENALVLAGPTGSGKTKLGIQLAQDLNAEIISMDSMALYRRMDIGTAKPTTAERAFVPHHLIDVREPWESASVAWWLEQAKSIATDIESRGKRVLFVGGTPLYLKALICGLFEGPPADDEIRRRLIEFAEVNGSPSLHARLAAVDGPSAERIHPNDVRRTVRALEVFELTGKPMSAWQTQWGGEKKEATGQLLWLNLDRTELYDRINRRIEQMFTDGLVDEVQRLRALDRPLSPEAGQALGYKEVFDLLDGKVSQSETITLIQTRSRNFAKRQISWFRQMPECRAATVELTRSLWTPKMYK
jgi:tRNA dimethylallyltransferase